MVNPHGTPIWYELLTTDHGASKAFYEAVVGWNIGPQPEGDVDYRMIETGHDGAVGGVMQLTDGMLANGAKPTWLFYIGVDDVDATVDKVTAAGGRIHLPAFDMPGVGRMAMVADPQGNPFYVMRGASDDSSTAWHATRLGKCSWNELATTDQAAGNAFYADVLGWRYPDKMSMGPAGDYVFVEAGGETIGATMPPYDGQPNGWRFYFRTSDIEAAAATVEQRGGAVLQGPMEVPGGDMVIVATDPLGVSFGVVAAAKTA